MRGTDGRTDGADGGATQRKLSDARARIPERACTKEEDGAILYSRLMIGLNHRGGSG